MPDYIIAYHGGTKPDSPQEGAEHMAKWQAWITDLGEAVVNPGTPLGPSKMVSHKGVSDAGGANALSGFSIITADDMEAALLIARDCPFLDMGEVEVAQIMTMK